MITTSNMTISTGSAITGVSTGSTTNITIDPTVTTVMPTYEYEPLFTIKAPTTATICQFDGSPYVGMKKVDIIYQTNANGEEIACGVKVEFRDGDKQKAICSPDDSWSFEIGISICLTKHLLKKAGFKNPSAAYNNAIRSGVKVNLKEYEKNKLKEQQKAAIEYKKAKIALKKQRRADRKKNEEREEAIEIQKEAIIRAMRELDAIKGANPNV